MSSTQKNETQATAAQPKPSPVPDGKSKLPDNLPDFPVTNGGDPGPTRGPMPK